MKSVRHFSTTQHGDMKSGVSQFKNSAFSQARCATAPFFFKHVIVQLSPQTRKCNCFARFWVGLRLEITLRHD